jgi:phosphoglycolate phosphatase-like HAD superfamily hydrolase
VTGDTEEDISAARELDLTSVCVLSGLRSRGFLRDQQPDYLIDSVARLPALLSGIRLLALELA